MFRRASSRSCRPSRKYCDTDFRTESTSESELDRAAEGPQDCYLGLTSAKGRGGGEAPKKHLRRDRNCRAARRAGWEADEPSQLNLQESKEGSEFLSALSYLRHMAAGKIHPADCYKAKEEVSMPATKRKPSDNKSEDTGHLKEHDAPQQGKKRGRTTSRGPVAAVAHFVTQRGDPWHQAVQQAAVLASADAEMEAEKAARNAIKHVYILAGYAEPRRTSSAAGRKSVAEEQPRPDAATICEARAAQDSNATNSASSKAEEQGHDRAASGSFKSSLPPLWLQKAQHPSSRMQMPSPLWQLPAQHAVHSQRLGQPPPSLWQNHSSLFAPKVQSQSAWSENLQPTMYRQCSTSQVRQSQATALHTQSRPECSQSLERKASSLPGMRATKKQQTYQRSDAPASSIAMAIAMPGKFVVRPRQQGAGHAASSQGDCGASQILWQSQTQQPNPHRSSGSQPFLGSSQKQEWTLQKEAASSGALQGPRFRGPVPLPGATPLQMPSQTSNQNSHTGWLHSYQDLQRLQQLGRLYESLHQGQMGIKQVNGQKNQAVHPACSAKGSNPAVKAPITPGLQPAIPSQLASSMQLLKPGHTSHPAKGDTKTLNKPVFSVKAFAGDLSPDKPGKYTGRYTTALTF